MPTPFLNRSRIPPDVFRDEALDYLDRLVEDVRRRRVDAIVVQDENRFRPPGMARALSQSYLYRCVEQAEAAAMLSDRHLWLSAMTVARSLLETIAAYHHQTRKIEAVVRTGDVQTIHDALHAAGFGTRIEELVEMAGDPAVRATNILTQIDSLSEHRPSVRQDYDYLSEHAHPNGLGTFLFFGRQDVERDIVEFNPEGWIADQALRWVGAAAYVLRAARDAADKMEEMAQEISRLGQAGPSPT